jgi:uncharacterized protein (DUF885 family)
MSITRRRREKRNHNKSKHMRGGMCSFSSNPSTSRTLFGGRSHTRRKQKGGDEPLQNTPSYFSDFTSQAHQQFKKGASDIYGRISDVSNHATQALQEQGIKVLDGLQSQAKVIIDDVKKQVNDITDAALEELKIQSRAAAKQAVADALFAAKSQIKMR